MATTKNESIDMALEINAIDGKETTRPLNDDEIAIRKSIRSEIIARQAEQEAKAKARESALAKLASLGLTEEEIASL
jgi:hypothetical protein